MLDEASDRGEGRCLSLWLLLPGEEVGLADGDEDAGTATGTPACCCRCCACCCWSSMRCFLLLIEAVASVAADAAICGCCGAGTATGMAMCRPYSCRVTAAEGGGGCGAFGDFFFCLEGDDGVDAWACTSNSSPSPLGT